MTLSWKETFRKVCITHFCIYLCSFLLSLIFIFHSSDAWYKTVRESYKWSFIKMHLAFLPDYFLISLFFSFIIYFILKFFEFFLIDKNFYKKNRFFYFILFSLWIVVFYFSFLNQYSAWSWLFSFLYPYLHFYISKENIHHFIYVMNAMLLLLCLMFFISYLLHFKKNYRINLYFLSFILSVFIFNSHYKIQSQFNHVAAANHDAQNSATHLPHIFVLASDSLRTKNLSAYHYARNTSPNIKKIAEESWVAENMYVASPSTTESLFAIFTGLSPYQSGMHTIFPSREQSVKIQQLPQLAQSLKKLGYYTLAAGDWAASDISKLSNGFDECYIDHEWALKDYIDGALRQVHLLPMAFYTALSPYTQMANRYQIFQRGHSHQEIIQHIQEKIVESKKNKQPLFVFLFLSTTHLPYQVPEGQKVIFGDPHYQGKHQTQVSFNVDDLIHKNMDEELKKDSSRIIDIYDSVVYAFDQQVVQIEKTIEKENLKDDSITLILSDHGDDQFEPGVAALGRSIHHGNQSITIPFILRWPKQIQAQHSFQPLQENDIAATLLDLISAKWEGGGRSFKNLLENKKDDQKREIFIEAGMSWAGPVLYPPESEHLSYPNLTNLALPDLNWDSRLTIEGESLNTLMKAKNRILIIGDEKIVYQPLKKGPWVYSCNMKIDEHCMQPQKADPELAQRLKYYISQEPKDYYLAWDEKIFNAAFE